VEPAQLGGDRPPVSGNWWSAVQPRLDNDSIDVAAAIQQRDDHRDPEALSGEMIEQVDFPVQTGGLPPRMPGSEPIASPPQLQHLVPVPPSMGPITVN
jgi:hypothetical protein